MAGCGAESRRVGKSRGLDMGGATRGGAAGGGGTTQMNFHFHGVTDHDFFKANQSQIANQFAMQLVARGRKMVIELAAGAW